MSLALSKATTFRTLICEKFLSICYYHSRCFGSVTYCISKSNYFTPPYGIALHAYEHKSLMWLTTGLRSLGSVLFFALFLYWKDYFFINWLHAIQLTSAVSCTICITLSQLRRSKRSVIAINNLFKLIHCIRQLHPNYEIYQISHLVLMSVKMMFIIYEIEGIIRVVMKYETISRCVMHMIGMYLIIGLFLNMHIACLLYVIIDALFGAFNHYMSSSFLVKIREAQESRNKSLPPATVKQFILELKKISQIYFDIHRVGIELHNILQVPVAVSMVFIHLAMMAVLYFLISMYFQAKLQHWQIPFLFKLTVDMALLSLAAHRAIKSSHTILRIGLDNIIILDNKDWHRNMELFLYRINLNDFKLNILGLFDITNALTLTFIAGILTSMTIFIPFAINAN